MKPKSAVFLAAALAMTPAEVIRPRSARRLSTCPQCKLKFDTQKRFCSVECYREYHSSKDLNDAN